MNPESRRRSPNPVPRRRLGIALAVLLAVSWTASLLAQDEADPDAFSETRRTVLELHMDPLGQGPARSVVAVAVDGPPDAERRSHLERDDVPFALSFSVGILDRVARVAEIHFFRSPGEGDEHEGEPRVVQKALLDDSAEVQVDLDADFTLVLRWVELRDEVAKVVEGEVVYERVQESR